MGAVDVVEEASYYCPPRSRSWGRNGEGACPLNANINDCNQKTTDFALTNGVSFCCWLAYWIGFRLCCYVGWDTPPLIQCSPNVHRQPSPRILARHRLKWQVARCVGSPRIKSNFRILNESAWRKVRSPRAKPVPVPLIAVARLHRVWSSARGHRRYFYFC